MSKDSTASTLGVDTTDATAQQAAQDQQASTKTPAKTGKGELDKGLINQGFGGKRATIHLNPARDDSEQDFVFVSVNSVGFQIPRGKDFSVPVEVISVLDDAVQMVYGKDGKGREIPRHSYRVIG